MDQNPHISSHSFRVGFITQLWRDTNDIEFVRQAIGHAKICFSRIDWGRVWKENFFNILNNRKESSILKKDFKRQAILELNPKICQFSEIIDNLYLALEAFDEEPEVGNLAFLTEDPLRQVVKDILPKVEKYFIDEI